MSYAVRVKLSFEQRAELYSYCDDVGESISDIVRQALFDQGVLKRRSAS